MSDEAKALAARILADYGGRVFEYCKFYGLNQMAPNDASFRIVSAQAEGDQLSLGTMHSSGEGRVASIVVQSPRGLKPASTGKGFEIESAESLAYGDGRVELKGTAEIIQHTGGRAESWPRRGPALLITTS